MVIGLTERDRRHFQRIGLEREVLVEAIGQPAPLSCRLTDISLRGLLLEAGPEWSPVLGQLVDLAVILDEQGQRRIVVKGEVRHIEGGQVGVQVLEIDLDSVALLRRLVEVNIDDESRLEMELSAMISEREATR